MSNSSISTQDSPIGARTRLTQELSDTDVIIGAKADGGILVEVFPLIDGAALPCRGISSIVLLEVKEELFIYHHAESTARQSYRGGP